MMVPADPLAPLRTLLSEGRFREAVEWRLEGEAAVTGRPDGRLMAATAALRIGEVELGQQDAVLALDEFTAQTDRDGRMRCLNLLGAVAFERGNMESAGERFTAGLELAQALNDTLTTARASNNLAAVAHLQGNNEKALSLYRTALLAYHRLGDRRGAAETYHNLNMTFRQLHMWHDAQDAAAEAVRHADMVGESWLKSLVLTGKAELHLELGEPRIAEQILDHAESLAQKSGDEVGIGEICRLRALIALLREEPRDALDHASNGLAIAARLGSALLEGECAAAAARASRALGREDSTSHYRKLATSRFEKLGANRLLDDLQRNLAG